MNLRPDYREELRADLVDVKWLLEELGVIDGPSSYQRQAHGVVCRCPWHNDRSPSCSVQVKNGAIVAHCFACDRGGDVFDFIAEVRGLDTRSRFREVMVEAAQLASRFEIVEALRNGAPLPAFVPRPPPAPPEPPKYPPLADVAAVWASAGKASSDAEVSAWLVSRAIDPDAVDAFDLARAMGTSVLRPWARSGGRSWVESGHRCIVPLFDASGALRSLRGRLVTGGTSTKCLATTGYETKGLILADRGAREMLRTGALPGGRLIIAEGEPDFLTFASSISDADECPAGVLGIPGGGTWSHEIADRIPSGSTVAIWTHHDANGTGEKYAQAVIAALAGRCDLLRGK